MKIRQRKDRVLFVGALAAVLAAGAAHGVTLTENFDGTTLNPTNWQFVATNAVASVENGLVIDIPANPAADWRAGVQCTWPLLGDFDVQVDYSLGTAWTNFQNYGVAVGLSTPASGMTVYRCSTFEYYLGVIPKERYFANASGTYFQPDTVDVQGKLRFKRSNESEEDWGMFRAYYWDSVSNNWHEIMNRTHQSGSEAFFLGAWDLGGGGIGAPLKITFSNLVAMIQSAPTGIALSNSAVEENQPSGTAVGAFSTTDLDTGDTFSYTLAAGAGDEDNSSFTINGSNLLTAASFNYEIKSNYSIRVQSADQGGLSTQEVFAIHVLQGASLLVSPTNRAVSAAAGSTTFAVTNAGGGTMVYSAAASNAWLVITNGAGGTNNGTVMVAYEANPGSTARTGLVTVTASGALNSPATLTVVQAGMTWDAGYQDLGGGWRRLTWFGDYAVMGAEGWIWHNKHGFFYVAATSTPGDVWLFANDMGWLYTGNTLYPFLYRSSPASWLWYNGATNPRWFMNLTTSQWEWRP